MTREDLEDLVKRTQEDAMTPLNRQLLVDLEAWRAYLRVLLSRLEPVWKNDDNYQAFQAFAIADDALALSLNKAIGEK